MKIGIRARLIISILIMLLLAFLFSGFILIRDSELRLDSFHHTQVKYQAGTLAGASLDALVSEDYEVLERLVSSAMPSDEYAYAGLIKTDGQVITHTNLYLIGKIISTLKENSKQTLHEIEYEQRPVMEAVHPVMIGEKHLANAHVAYYLDEHDDLDEETTARLVAVLLVTSFFMLLGVVLIVNQYIDPLRKLTESIAQFSIKKGIKIAPPVVNRNDEVGALAKTFVNLSYRLLDSYKELEVKSHELEDRVKERTLELEDANKHLQERESYINAIVENVVDAIVTINTKGVIETYNNSAETLFGYKKEEAIGQNITILMPEDEKLKHDGYINHYIQGGTPGIIGLGGRELIGKNKNGKTFPMELLINELIKDDDHIFIGTMRDITERKLSEEGLRYAAEHDVLTGLYNRKYFEEELGRVLERARRGQCDSSALFFIDLDKFKYVNDTLGHAAGDKVLLDITEIMKNRVRKSDLVARLGGDEFVVLIYDTDADITIQVAESFRKLISDYKYRQDGKQVDVSCSIGITMIGKDYESITDLLADADAACYKAKYAGRNCIRMHEKRDSK